MLKILIVSATAKEVSGIINHLTFEDKIDNTFACYKYNNMDIDILITGIGSIFTTYYLTQTLAYRSYDLVLNVGIAGSFDSYLELGYIVNVYQDQFADLGIEDKNSFYTLFEKELLQENAFPFTDGVLRNNTKFKIEEIDRMINVSGITVNTVHGNLERIQKSVKKYKAEVETMDGAAFFYVCMKEGLPFYQIKAISNYVELRKVENWNLPIALENLSNTLMAILEELKMRLE